MSCFDEEPDGDIHGECSFEIHRLKAEVAKLKAALSQQEAVAWARNGSLTSLQKGYSDREVVNREKSEEQHFVVPLFTHPQPQKVDSCDCGDKSQCWEPCGELGHSEDHIVDANKMVEPSPQPVASVPQDVEEFIKAKSFETSHKSGRLIKEDDLRTFLSQRDAGCVGVPVEPTEEMVLAAINTVAVRKIPFINDTQKVTAIYRAMLTASKEGA